MRLNELKLKLIAAARADIPSDNVPHAFEKRIMALLSGRPVVDSLTLWSQALWRAAVSCMAIVLVLGISSFILPSEPSPAAGKTANLSEDLSQAFENTLFVSVDQSANSFEELQ